MHHIRWLVPVFALLVAVGCSGSADPGGAAPEIGSTRSAGTAATAGSSSTSAVTADRPFEDPASVPTSTVAAPAAVAAGRCEGEPYAGFENLVFLQIDGGPDVVLCDPATGHRSDPFYSHSDVVAAVVDRDGEAISAVLLGPLSDGGDWWGVEYAVGGDGFIPRGGRYEAESGQSSIRCRDGRVVQILFEPLVDSEDPTLRWSELIGGAETGRGAFDLRSEYKAAAELVVAHCNGVTLGLQRSAFAAELLGLLLAELGLTEPGFDHSIDPTSAAFATFDGATYSFSIDLDPDPAGPAGPVGTDGEVDGPWLADCNLGLITVRPSPTAGLAERLLDRAGCAAR